MKDAVLARLERHFPGETLTTERASAGHRRVLFIRSSGKPRAVVKFFRGPLNLCRYVGALKLFQREGLSAPRLLFADYGPRTRLSCGGFVLAQEWIVGPSLAEVISNEHAAAAAGQALAAVHQLRRRHPGRLGWLWWPRYGLWWLRKEFRWQMNLLQAVIPEVARRRVDIVAWLLKGFSEYPWDRPHCLCHMDPNPHNILIRNVESTPQAVFIDLATVRYYPPFYDLCRLNDHLERESTASASRFLEAYFDGGSPLDRQEWRRMERYYRAAFYLHNAAKRAGRSRDSKRAGRHQQYLEETRYLAGRLLETADPSSL